MSARLFVLLVVPAYVVLYAAIASSIKRRFGLVGLIIVAYLLWAVFRAGAFTGAHRAPRPASGRRQPSPRCRSRGGRGTRHHLHANTAAAADPGGPRDAMRALVIGVVLVTTILLAGLILIVQMAP
jgi:hypothetical protein